MSADDSAPNALTRIVQNARSGLEHDIRALAAALPSAQFLLPIKRGVSAAPVGQTVAINQAVDLSPHYLPDARGMRVLGLFTYFAPLDRIVPSLGWTTDGGPLQLFALPGTAAFNLAYEVVDSWHVLSLVIDAGAPSELRLNRGEVKSLLAGEAPALAAHPAQPQCVAPSFVAEPVPPMLVRVLDACLRAHPEVRKHRVERVFEPGRDTTPRLLLRLWVSESAYRGALVRMIEDAVRDALPPPGELQVHFE